MEQKDKKQIAQDLINSQAEALEFEDTIWEEEPVSPGTFFEKFLHEPCYPEQQKFVDAILGKGAKTWDNKFCEAIALVGKGCIAEDTRIANACSGKVKTVREWAESNENLYVHSWNGSKVVIKKASTPYLMGRAPVLEIETDQGTIKVTEAHKFFTKDGWSPAERIVVGDYMLSPKEQIINCAEYPVSDEKIKLIGYLLGDGNLCHGNDPNPTVRCYNGNKRILDDFIQCVNQVSKYNIDCVIEPKDYCNSSVITLTRKNRKVGSSKNIINSVCKRFGIYKLKAHNKVVPVEFFQLSSRQSALLLGVLWSTDGWVYVEKTEKTKNPQIEVGYSSKSRALCEDIVFLLKKLGIVSRIRYKTIKNTKYYTVYIKSKKYCREFCTKLTVIGKEQKQKELLRKAHYKVNKRYISSFIKNENERGYIWSKVLSIKSVGLQEYYDLTVEDTECYFAGGVLNHNGGKDRTIAKILTYCVYKLLCLRNPQNFLGLNDNDIDSPDSAIDIGNVCINARLAKDVFFKNFVAMIKASKNPKTGGNWFAEHGVNLKTDIHKREIEFPKHITAYSLDSEEYTGEGLNLLLVIFDEVGGFDPEKAAGLYTALTTTQKTRFGNNRKTLLLSFKRDDNDFMMIRYHQSESEKTTYRVRAATWEWNPKRSKQDFADDYLRSPEDAQRIFECKGSTVKEGYFKYKKRIKDSINPNRINPTIEKIFWTNDILKLKFEPFFVPKKWQPYFLHIDLSKGKESGDYAGLALGHFVRNQDVKLSSEYLQELTKVEGFQISKLNKQKQVGVVIDLLLQLRAKPGQEIIFDEIRQFIQGLRQAGYYIKMVTYDGWQCNLGSNKIKLINGHNLRIDEITKPTWIYSYNRKTKQIVPALCKPVRKTGTKVPVYNITLDNGETVGFTPEHLILMRDGSYKEVRALKSGDSLMPLYTRLKKIGNRDYEQIKLSGVFKDKWEFTHRLVSKKFDKNSGKKDYVVHHYNFDSLDNTPSNLKVIKWYDHVKLHKKLCDLRWAKPGEREKQAILMVERNKKFNLPSLLKPPTKKTAKKISESISKLWRNGEYKCSMSKAHKGNKGYWTGKTRSLETIEKIRQSKLGRKLSKEHKVKITQGLNNFYNHKVVKVEFAGYEDVYDVEVPDTCNLALEAGIFSHNSVDSIQILNKAGIPAEVQSVDRNTEAYDTMKEVMYKGLLDMYDHPIFIRECEELIRTDRGKVDHPELSYRRSVSDERRMEGSKDVSDAAAGCAKLCVEYAKSTFSVGAASDVATKRAEDGFRPPDEAEKARLTFYGQRP